VRVEPAEGDVAGRHSRGQTTKEQSA
jgi:hypothetical protein